MCTDCMPIVPLPCQLHTFFHLSFCRRCLSCMFGCTTFGILLTPLQIEITHRVAWSATRYRCDQTTVSSQTLISGEGNLMCQSGCSGTVGRMSFYCTNFSTSGDWTTGGRTYTYNATGITSFEAS